MHRFMDGILLLLLATMAATSSHAFQPDLIWLSDVAPKRAKRPAQMEHTGHDHAGKHQDNMDAVIGGEEGDNIHNGVKRLWLRRGADPAGASYVSAEGMPADIALLDAKGNRSTVAQTPSNGLAHVRCEFEDLGFRNAYLTSESVKDGTLRVQLAKAELLKGTCCAKDVDLDPDQKKAISDPMLPLEIVRERHHKEKLMTRIASGDKVAFLVNRLGKPMAGVPVTMLTQQGWQRTAMTDENGRAEFTMIRDYFPAWSDFRRRTKESFVVVAEAEVAESGMHRDQPYSKVAYQATLSGKYQPTPYDYKSYAWGLGIAIFVLAFGGLAVYLYRRRRIKPFREVRFNESA